jgi:hypothetical protein
LLNYGAIVLSEHSDHLDEESFRGLVTFTTPEKIAEAYRNVTAMPHAERIAFAQQRRSEFMRRFEPSLLFKQAGVYDMLDARLAARDADRKLVGWIGRGVH